MKFHILSAACSAFGLLFARVLADLFADAVTDLNKLVFTLVSIRMSQKSISIERIYMPEHWTA
jgi:hypothetical protein